MVSMTRAKEKEAFNMIKDDVIDSLTYEDPNDKIYYPVKKGDKMLLGFFLAYAQSSEPATDNVDYRAITQSNFEF
jgi:hypothetical protein